MIELIEKHLQIIFNHAEATYPEECCGVMLGNISNNCKTVIEIIPTQNAWNQETAGNFQDNHPNYSKKRRYTIEPREMLQIQKSARDKNLNIIGIFHSHPDYQAIPSEFDRISAWEEYSYIIVSVQKGQAGEINSWILDDNHQFQQEILLMGNG